MDDAQLKRALLSVVNRYLHGSSLCEDVDWGQVYRFAKMHSLVGVFYLSTKDCNLPKEVANNARADFELLVMQQALQDYYAQELFEKFKEKNLKFLPLKGYRARRLYTQPEARSSCDLDVFYEAKDKQEIDKVLTEVGFTFAIEAQNHQEWRKDTVLVEMHYSLLEQVALVEEYYQDVWERLQQVDGSEYAFSNEDEYIYHLVHAAKHIAHSGFGVRIVLDTYLYRQKLSLDEEYLQRELAKIGLQTFAEKLEKLANVWFGTGQATEEITFLGDYVFSCGVYGNRSNLAVRGGESVGKSKITHLRRAIFPHYKNMRVWYPIVKKVPVLLPFVWIYRWFEVLFTRRKSISKIAGDLRHVDEKSIQGMKKIKEMMGVTHFGDV